MTLPLRPALALSLAGLIGAAALAQQAPLYDDVEQTRRALSQAQTDGEIAHARAERLEAQAASASAEADRTASQQAAVAARIQQTQASMAAQEAQARLIARERGVLAAQLAQKQQPLVRLTAALQRLSRRPAALALLRPGSIRDTMHMRALFDTMLPVIERRTAALRQDIARGRSLEARALLAARRLRESGAQLSSQRRALLALETRQRLESRDATGAADRESERALALAEQARDLTGLVDELGEAGELRARLAALPGPIERPALPAQAAFAQADAAPAPAAPAGPREYLLPVAGRLVAGFGVIGPNQTRSRGLMLAARPGAQIVAPVAGRVVFAGPFRGYGRIVIIEHGEWTTLVTGLSQLDARVGQMLVAGSPLGLAGPGSPLVTLELRRAGEPVNPLEFIGQL